MKVRLLALSGLFFSSITFAETAVICESCSTESAAEAFAKSNANTLQCSSEFGPDITCQSINKVITFVDSNSGQAYKYNVFHERDFPWSVQAERIPLSSDREESFRILMKFVRDSNSAITEASADSHEILGSFNISSSSANRSSNSDGACPTDTALSALTNPNTLDSIQNRAAIEIGTKLISRNNDLNLNPVKIDRSYSLSFLGLTSSILADSASRDPSFIVTFDESERPGSRKDFFAYQVSILGFDEQNLPIMNFNLLGASQVAGYRLENLSGSSGSLAIENECVKERLEEAVNNGVLTPAVNLGGSAGGEPAPAPPGPGWTFPTSGGCQIVDFYQGGTLLYTFRVCS
ncbi:hypothetical protein CWE12_00740 [Aliidiomarina sedimenti]|uniref:Uncharacterized protein n=1 Tax=Aliidiomarina sedimenti TaxID=1933879 RepID=A0ABY0C169_9GAMM|nr:hypothetical protein [Aliidiomarina sedimenti]RUO31559.1 hypothetical protein CWE12_00740 [Aliidiomarina sedimenti]